MPLLEQWGLAMWVLFQLVWSFSNNGCASSFPVFVIENAHAYAAEVWKEVHMQVKA